MRFKISSPNSSSSLNNEQKVNFSIEFAPKPALDPLPPCNLPFRHRLRPRYVKDLVLDDLAATGGYGAGEIGGRVRWNPTVAFLFLARVGSPLDFIWHAFFQNAEEGSFSIYVHSSHGFLFDESMTRSPFFFGSKVENSVQVAWGEASMIQVERILLRKALEDPANQRFLDKKDDKMDGPKMSPTFPKNKWRKGSQWVTLVRKNATVVIADYAIFLVFRKHCKQQPDLDLEGKQNAIHN